MKSIINNKRKSEILVEGIVQLHPGDVITHQQIAALIDEAYPSGKYTYNLQKARQVLLEKGIILESISGDGYRVATPGAFVDESLKQYSKGLTAFQKGKQILNHAPVSRMTAEERDVYQKVYDKAATLNASVSKACVELAKIPRKIHPLTPELVGRM